MVEVKKQLDRGSKYNSISLLRSLMLVWNGRTSNIMFGNYIHDYFYYVWKLIYKLLISMLIIN